MDDETTEPYGSTTPKGPHPGGLDFERLVQDGEVTPGSRERGDTGERVRDARPVTDDRLRMRMMRHRIRAMVTSDATPYRIGGRYVVDEEHGEGGRLGKGGMGVVYAVRDVELGRRCVAKFMYRGGDDRFRREAQMLALFSHPNIVQVHDTGYDEDDFFIVMSYVAGEDLRTWAAGPALRSWREIVEVFVQIARGLAEAHANRVVHRDVTPGNIRISRRDDAWVAQILDFGIAGQLEPESDGDGAPLYTSGRLGTPGYMSPEQCGGVGASAQSDQFSLCICLYEALFGERPFGQLHAGEGYVEDLRAYERRVAAGEASVPRGVASPLRRLFHGVLRRGLRPDPRDRFPDMAALQRALAAELVRPERVRRGALMAGLVGLGLFGGAWGAWQPSPRASEVCVFDAEVEAAWGEAQRSRVSEPIAKRLDRVRDAWLQTREQSCGEALLGVAPERAAAQLECLDQQLAVLAEVGRHLVESGDSQVAWELLPSEAEVMACARVEPGLEPRLPDDASAEVERLLAQAEGALITGRYDEAREVAAMAVRRAEAMPEGPLLARALYEDARGQTYGVAPRAAMATLQRAALLADRFHFEDLAADIKLRQLRITATHGDEAAAAQYFEGLRERLAWLGERDGLREAEGRQFMADLALRRRDADEAEREVEIVERLRGRASLWERARSLELRGRLELVRAYAAQSEGRQAWGAVARESFERALVMQQMELGPRHPQHAPLLTKVAIAANLTGDFAAAQEALQQARSMPRVETKELAMIDSVLCEMAVKPEELVRACSTGLDRVESVGPNNDLKGPELTMFGRLLSVYQEEKTALLAIIARMTARFTALSDHSLPDFANHMGDAMMLAVDHGAWALAEQALDRLGGRPGFAMHALAAARLHHVRGRRGPAEAALAAALHMAAAEGDEDTRIEAEQWARQEKFSVER